MKKAILFITSSCLVGVLLVVAMFLIVTQCPKGVFADSYMAVLRTKYKVLKETNEPKIIIVSGSSAAFSMDNALLEQETGYKIANTALHAGVGALYELEFSKANINKGDIVLLGFEWGWNEPGYFDSINLELIMSGVDDEIEMYRYFPKNKYKDLIGYLPVFASVKSAYEGSAVGAYASSSFDETRNMTVLREDSPISKTIETHPEEVEYINEIDPIVAPDVVEKLVEYKEYVESMGATVYWIGCPTYRRAVRCDYSAFSKLSKNLEEETGIQVISNQLDYLLPGEYMYDTIYHCNTLGAEYRTNLLIDDLKRAGLVK